MELSDPFGPLTTYEQINDIAEMFEADERRRLRPLIGKIIKMYDYDVALFVFGQLRSENTQPSNMWAYIMWKAKLRANEVSDEDNKKNWSKGMTKGNIISMMDTLFLEGKITPEEWEQVKNVDDAKDIIDSILEREYGGSSNNG